MPVSSEILEACASLHDQAPQRIRMSGLWAVCAHLVRVPLHGDCSHHTMSRTNQNQLDAFRNRVMIFAGSNAGGAAQAVVGTAEWHPLQNWHVGANPDGHAAEGPA